MATGKFKLGNAANDTLMDLCHGATSVSGSSGASTVIQIDVTTALGGASNTIYLFGFLY